MGANTFYSAARRGSLQIGYETIQQGPHMISHPVYGDWPNAQMAFDSLCNNDRYENGHSYSGGIGMKHDFVHVAAVKTSEEAYALANKLIEDCDPRVDDKWGPAGCITIEEGTSQFLFFGWASS